MREVRPDGHGAEAQRRTGWGRAALGDAAAQCPGTGPPVSGAVHERACAQAVREAGARAGTPPSERARRAAAWARSEGKLRAALARNRREAPLHIGAQGAGTEEGAREALEDTVTELALAHAGECMRVLRGIAGAGDAQLDAHARAAFERAARADTAAWMGAQAQEERWVAALAAAGRASARRTWTTLRITLGRAHALSTVRRAIWDALGRWPPWAAALAIEHASVAALGEGRDAAVHDAACSLAAEAGIDPPEPERLRASLATWPFARTRPPVRVAAACAQAGVEAIEGESAWGGAVRAEAAAEQGGLGRRGGEGAGQRARRLRAQIEGERALVIAAMATSVQRGGGAGARQKVDGPFAPVLKEGPAGEIAWRIEHDREAHIEAIAGIGERTTEEVRGGRECATLVTVEATWPSRGRAALREAGGIESYQIERDEGISIEIGHATEPRRAQA